MDADGWVDVDGREEHGTWVKEHGSRVCRFLSGLAKRVRSDSLLFCAFQRFNVANSALEIMAWAVADFSSTDLPLNLALGAQRAAHLPYTLSR